MNRICFNWNKLFCSISLLQILVMKTMQNNIPHHASSKLGDFNRNNIMAHCSSHFLNTKKIGILNAEHIFLCVCRFSLHTIVLTDISCSKKQKKEEYTNTEKLCFFINFYKTTKYLFIKSSAKSNGEKYRFCISFRNI